MGVTTVGDCTVLYCREYAVVKEWAGRKEVVIVNYYNLCKRLELRKFEKVEGQGCSNTVK